VRDLDRYSGTERGSIRKWEWLESSPTNDDLLIIIENLAARSASQGDEDMKRAGSEILC
jgi:hypothetical protein